MKVEELIAELQGMPQDAEVHFIYKYGDYWRTTVAPAVSEVFEGRVKFSEYHRMDKLEDDNYDDEPSEGKMVVVLG